MKFLIATMLLSIVIPAVCATIEFKKVCHPVADKNGKISQVCKQFRIHKKLDGTKIPNIK